MSICKDCGQDILWIRRPDSEKFFPPFDDSHRLGQLDYEVSWDTERGDWQAIVLDDVVTVKLTQHRCEVRRQRVTEERAEKDARHAARMRAYEESAAEPPEPPEPIVRTEVQYVERWRDPAPDKLITIALRLRERCPTCGALPFVWCHYKLAPDEPTTQLHTSRRVNGGRREDG